MRIRTLARLAFGGVLLTEGGAALHRFEARRRLFAAAARRAYELGRPLVVIGDPDAGAHTRLVRAYGGGVRSRSAELPPPLLTVRDLALLLATSSAGVYSRVARGQVPGVLRIGRSIRFDPRVIAQWLSANSASAGGHP
jgi:predicted DNA-binding transcriptional regulator AlpA